jgi:hypothetical protein
VVVASWSEERGNATGGTSRLKEVKETLTDKSGEWTISGPKGTSNEFLENVYIILTLFTGTYYTKPPSFIIFKPGYCSYPKGFEIEQCKGKLRPYGVGSNETTELPKLSVRDRETLLRNTPFVTSEASEKTPIFHNLLDRDLAHIAE